MPADRYTPSPQTWECRSHSGVVERIRDLEGRSLAASNERESMRKDIVDMKIEQAKVTQRWSIIVIAVNAAIAAIVVAIAKIIFGG